ncbi:MAG: HipA domain-containing protein [bacterium]|nr:HipA domain-containing protein [bacterium]
MSIKPELMKKHLPAYKIEAPKLFKLLLFNYLYSNGDAHFKNFSLLETPMGDYRLSPAYDLLNTRLHIADKDFALDHGLLTPNKNKGKILHQFKTLGQLAGISNQQIELALKMITNGSEKAEILVKASYLNDKSKRNYWQSYQGKLKNLIA